MYSACKKTNDKPFPNAAAANVRSLKRIANIFMQLQQQRHTADYDNSKRWGRTEVLTQIDMAHEAFDLWERIRTDEIAEDFLLLLLIDKRRS
jgi:hypothetical protein